MPMHRLPLALLCAVAGCLPTQVVQAQALGTAFSYQGQLKEAGQPATGLYDFQVCLFPDTSTPVPLACQPDFNDIPVDGGLFTVLLDFNDGFFVGQTRYLEFRVRPGASTGGYTQLSPRQLVRPTPEALRANAASAAPWSGITGVPAGFADNVDNVGTGTVTSVATGAGLSGGPITDSGVLTVADGGITTAMLGPAVVGLGQINTAQVQSRLNAFFGSGNVAAIANTLTFITVPIPVTLASGTRALVNASAALGSIAAGGGSGLAIFICTRLVPGGALSQVGGGMFGLSVPQNQRHTYSVSAVTPVLPAGTYEVGMCGNANVPANWNSNEWGYTSVLVF